MDNDEFEPLEDDEDVEDVEDLDAADLDDPELDDAELDDADLDAAALEGEEAGEADFDDEQVESIEDLEEAEAEADVDEDDAAAGLLLADLDDAPDFTDPDDEELDGLRDGEFVCRSCFMAKRESALADPKRMLCRDCA